ncbi:hypothetical protein AB0M05_28930 [Streptomyces violaceusniger]
MLLVLAVYLCICIAYGVLSCPGSAEGALQPLSVIGTQRMGIRG